MIAGRLARLGGDPLAAGMLPRAARGSAALAFLAALLAFLAVLALAVGLAAGRLVAGWQEATPQSATLQVVAPDAEIEGQARAALDVLRQTPGVVSVRMIDVAEQERLLAPWLGPHVPIESLPVPLMVDVAIDRAVLDEPALDERLRAAAPAAVWDDHSAWRQPLAESARRLRLLAFGCLGLLGLGMAAAGGLTAQAAVAGHGSEIATLRLVGAADRFIRDAATSRGRLAALAGGLAGTLAGAFLLARLPATSESGFFLVAIGLSGWQWLAVPLVPLGGTALAWGAGGLVAQRAIRRWS